MEASLQSPSIESFSYSWLSNLKPDSLISAVDQDDQHNSFIEMDPRLPPSKRFIRVSSDFGFDFPISESPFGLVHADEVISNGFLVPLFVKDEKIEGHDGAGNYLLRRRLGLASPTPLMIIGADLVILRALFMKQCSIVKELKANN
ncbi:hypothetical protein ACS0TY_004623 [Phlomoides rotata]